MICYTYTTGSSALPDIYAQARGPQARGRVRTYQAKHECLWYKCYVPHCPCRLIARQYEAKTRIYRGFARVTHYDTTLCHQKTDHTVPLESF